MTEPTSDPEVLDLLTAIRDAVDVPLPTTDEADERAWHRLMNQRLTDLRIVLNVALDPTWVSALDLATEAANIRARTAETPVTYALYERPSGGAS